MTIWVPELAGNGPRYRELANAIAHAVQSGELGPGTKLPTQRRLAEALGVTVGTVTRAYSEAERGGWLVPALAAALCARCRRKTGVFARQRRARRQRLGDLSLALPPADAERAAALSRALSEVQADPVAMAEALDYQPESGLDWHREIYAEWMGRLGLPVAANELVIDQGGMNGIFIALSTLARPGGRIAAERLCYPA